MSEKPTRLEKIRRQFRFNIYIRFMMMAYFDFVTVALQRIRLSTKSWISMTKLISVVGLAALIILPIFAMGALLVRFEFFLNKSSKKTLGALLENIDKGTRTRVIQPAFFFVRRIIYAYLISISDGPSAQYAFL